MNSWSIVFLSASLFCCHAASKRNVLILVADDAGFETQVYGNKVCRTPHINQLGSVSGVFTNAFTTVSSCSPSRSTILTGLPQHQNGMYGLHQGVHHFNTFDSVMSLPRILNDHNIKTGIIGKKHVGPENVYPFNFSVTEDHHSMLQVGRNITNMKLLTQQFLSQVDDERFLLYIGFHDPHRCGHTHPEFGAFCEKFGADGSIPDWIPTHYDEAQVEVPYFVQNTSAARADIAAQYTTISRLDQGIGLILKELERSGHLNNTLIIYTSDNGIPFPSGRTNFYDPGMGEPMLISTPELRQANTQKKIVDLVNLLDILPTVLDWFGIDYPEYSIFMHGRKVELTGQSLLPLLDGRLAGPHGMAYGSHNHHEITMYYPMRAVRNERFKLIHNLNYKMPFPIDQDFYISRTFQDLLERTKDKVPTHWTKNLTTYYYRKEYELFDLRRDAHELTNVADIAAYSGVFHALKKELIFWQNVTTDPWICAPHAVLEDVGNYRDFPQCMPLYNL